MLVKQKGDTQKVRLIHDLSRSGVNHKIKLPESVVLPRLSDVTDGVVDMVRSGVPDQEVEFLVLDFKDAFKQLRVHPDERRYLSGVCSLGWFVYYCILFGVVQSRATLHVRASIDVER